MRFHKALTEYDKKSGREIWKTKRPVQIRWSTPVLVFSNGPVGGLTELLTNGAELIRRV